MNKKKHNRKRDKRKKRKKRQAAKVLIVMDELADSDTEWPTEYLCEFPKCEDK